MPRVLPSNAETWLAKRGVIDRPVILADIQTLDGTQFFWSDEDGYLPTIFPLGTRIQSSGGTSSQQYALGVTTTVAGDRCFVSVVVKNQGSKTVIIGSNGNGGDPSATIAPGSTQRVTINGTSVGNGLQITFNTQAVGDSWDVIAYNPLVTKN
ncbi:MAG TPA: hypothetical protein VFL42_00580, partial [Terriglobales bacterium]|nr:hypothetical protein [Terriglobales bacterium]